MIVLAMLLAGCFSLPSDIAQLDTRTIPFDNQHVTADGVVIESFETDLPCPNGEPSRFQLVYQPGTITPAPIAIVMHSGAFDYVMEVGSTGPLSGTNYHSSSRLNPDFATKKVWETLGLQIEDVDPAEDNQGTLPAALANRGFVQMHPGNCWGDLWHNEEGVQYNDMARDGFERNGRTLAWWMVRIATDPDFARTREIEMPVPVDPSQLYLFGMGDGGRGVLEMLTHDAAPKFSGALVDSMPDNLSAYTSQPDIFEEEIEGMSRIFGEDAMPSIEEYSFAAMPPMPDRMVYLWSSGDPQLPSEAAAPAANALNGVMGVQVVQQTTPDHVLSNSDMDLANQVLDYLVSEDEVE